MSIRVAKLQDVAAEQALLFKGQPVRLVNPITHTNLADQPNSPVRQFILSSNAARVAWEPPVKLWRYGSGTLVCGEASGLYLTLSDGALIAQQLGDWFTDTAALAACVLALAGTAPGVAEECLLVAHQRDTIWGHWHNEMLSKIVLAEAMYPGRFRYVVPARVTRRGQSVSDQYVTAILSSLDAYGVTEDRLLRISLDEALRFDALFDMSGVWPMEGEELTGLHSEVIKLMNRQLRKSGDIEVPRLVFVARPGNLRRTIANGKEVAERAKKHGFVPIDLAACSMPDQVRLFRRAEFIAGVHGSGFSGIMYAPWEKRVLTMAAAEWTDIYFVTHFQKRRVRQADLRGRVVPGKEELVTQRDVYIEPHAFDEAIEVMMSGRAILPDIGAVSFERMIMPRALGDTLFEIDFSKDGKAERFTRSGWSGQEAHCRWSVGEKCALEVPPFVVPQTHLWLTVTGAWIDGHMKTLTAIVNDTRFDTQAIEGQCRLAWLVPRDVWTSHTPARLEFEHPAGPSPKARGVSDDDRALGFRFGHIALSRFVRMGES